MGGDGLLIRVSGEYGISWEAMGVNGPGWGMNRKIQENGPIEGTRSK